MSDKHQDYRHNRDDRDSVPNGSSPADHRGLGSGPPHRRDEYRHPHQGGKGGSSRGQGPKQYLEPASAPIVLPEDNINNQRKFTGRNRLFIGNLPKGYKEDDFKAMFEEYGEVSETFVSEKGFGFVTYDTRVNAQRAKMTLDGTDVGGRPMRVRFATHAAAVRVKELPAYVSNELLYEAFRGFGDIERAVHIVDDKGRPTGEGIVEFARKQGAQDCLRKVAEGVFLLTWSPKPVVAEWLEQKDEEDGLAERMIPKNPQFIKERENGPRFALVGSFEHEFGSRWKQQYMNEKRRRDMLEQEFQAERDRLGGEMEMAYQDHQANILREDLKRRQEELDRIEQERQRRLEQMRSRGGPGPSGPPPFGAPYQPQQQQSIFTQYGAPQQQGNAALPPDFSEPPPLGSKRPADDNLLHGVQKLLKMYGSGVGEGFPPAFGAGDGRRDDMGQNMGMPQFPMAPGGDFGPGPGGPFQGPPPAEYGQFLPGGLGFPGDGGQNERSNRRDQGNRFADLY